MIVNAVTPDDKRKIFVYEFLNFVEVFVHVVLYTQNVFPKEAFVPHCEYSLSFLKYIPDNDVCAYIASFLSSIETMLEANALTKVNIVVVDAETNESVEMVQVNVTRNRHEVLIANDNDSDGDNALKEYHQELCLGFRSLIYDFYYGNVNKKDNTSERVNTTFYLGIETNNTEGKALLHDKQVYNNITQTINDNYIHNINYTNYSKRREIAYYDSDNNYSISIEQRS